MKNRSYDSKILKELAELTELALERERSARLDDVSKSLNRWKKGGIGSAEALENIRRSAGTPEVSWHKDADPGVPVAHAVAMGLLFREDLSDGVWNSIEVLITLAGI